MLSIFVRTILVYFLLALSMQLTGKRQIGQMQISELICALLLSELAAAPISDTSLPLLHVLVPVVAVLTLEVILSFLITKSHILRKIFDAQPSIIIHKGVLDQKALAAARVSLDELLGFMRLQGISTVAEVEYAVLEHNGQISFLQKADARPPCAKDLSLSPAEEGIAHPLVLDGELQPAGLILVKKTEDWVLGRIRAAHYSLSDIFLFTLDDGGNEVLIPRLDAKEVG